MDETKLKLRGEHIFCWTAIDDERKLLAFGVSEGRSSLEGLRFLGKLLELCEEGSIVYTDGGMWYPWACERLGFEHMPVDFGGNNRVERLFRTGRTGLEGSITRLRREPRKRSAGPRR